MLFTKTAIVLTTHTEGAPLEETIKIAHGIITWISVFFPPGCHNLVHCVILHHEHQIAPSTEGMSLVGDGAPIEWSEYYESYQPAYELKVKLWGVGCGYDHKVIIRIAILPRKAVLALALVDIIKNLFGVLSPKRIFTSKG
jgi:hypothetical protein